MTPNRRCETELESSLLPNCALQRVVHGRVLGNGSAVFSSAPSSRSPYGFLSRSIGGSASGVYEIRWRPRFDAPPLVVLSPSGYALCFVNNTAPNTTVILCRSPFLQLRERAGAGADAADVEVASLSPLIGAAPSKRADEAAELAYESEGGTPAPSGFSFIAIGTGALAEEEDHVAAGAAPQHAQEERAGTATIGSEEVGAEGGQGVGSFWIG